jgi:acyl-CoA synthetase (NDP forming)
MVDTKRALSRMFRPRSVAVVGASEDPEKLSGQPVRNLLKTGYRGDVYAVNPRVRSVSGIRAYENLSRIEGPVDVAIICLPGNLAVEATEECAERGVQVAIVASSGFAEVGTPEGRDLQERLARIGERGTTRIVGPNCNGIYNALDRVSIGYNVTHGMVLKAGDVAVLSHSGALFSSVVSLGDKMGSGLGYSYFVSAGNEADLSLLDYMEYAIEDEPTRIVALILDGVGDVERFRALCRAAEDGGKRIVALKIGQSETGVDATLAHSSRLAGSARGYRALLAECGVVQAPSLEVLVGACAVLSKYGDIRSYDAVGLSTSGAGCALLADAAERYGVSFPPLRPETTDAMAQRKGFGTPMNPFDVGASGAGHTMGYMSRALASDLDAGFTLFYSTILQTERTRTAMAEQYASTCNELGRPPFLVIAPGPLTPEETRIYNENDILVFDSSDVALQTINALKEAGNGAVESARWPDPVYCIENVDGPLLDRAGVLEAFERLGIHLPREVLAESAGEIPETCRSVGYPVVVKGLSPDATHKSDAGLVWMNVSTDEEALRVAEEAGRLPGEGSEVEGFLVQELVRGEAEVLVGLNRDPDVGFVLVLGSGGKYSEILDDVVTCTIPSPRQHIRELLMETKAGEILSGARGNGLSPEGVVDVAFELQRLVAGNEHLISAIDINPLVVSPRRVVAVDVRVLLSPR